jgi:hypothetical protein
MAERRHILLFSTPGLGTLTNFDENRAILFADGMQRTGLLDE